MRRRPASRAPSPLPPAETATEAAVGIGAGVALGTALGAAIGLIVLRALRPSPPGARPLTDPAGALPAEAAALGPAPRDPRDGDALRVPARGPANPVALAQVLSGDPTLGPDGVARVLGAPVAELLHQGPSGVLYTGKAKAKAKAPAKGADPKAVKAASGLSFSALARAPRSAPLGRGLRPAGALTAPGVLPLSERKGGGAPSVKVAPPQPAKGDAQATVAAWAMDALAAGGVDCAAWRAQGEPWRLNTIRNWFYPDGGPPQVVMLPEDPALLRDWINALCGATDAAPNARPADAPAPPGGWTEEAVLGWVLDRLQHFGVRPESWREQRDEARLRLLRQVFYAAIVSTQDTGPAGRLPPSEELLARVDRVWGPPSFAERGRDWRAQLEAAGLTCAAFLALEPWRQTDSLRAMRAAGRFRSRAADLPGDVIRGVRAACVGAAARTGTDVADAQMARLRTLAGGDCATWDSLDKVGQMRLVNEAFPELGHDRHNLYRLSLARYDLCHPESEPGWQASADDWSHGLAASNDEGFDLTGPSSRTQWVRQGTFMPPGGPDLFDPIQGALGDCYLVAAMASLAWTVPDRVAALGAPVGADRRRFLFGRTAVDVSERTPCVILREYMAPFCRSHRLDAQWPAVLEKAYASWRTGDRTDRPDLTTLDNSQSGPDFAQHDVSIFASTAMPIVDLTGGRPFWYLSWFRSDDAFFDLVGRLCAPNGRILSPTVAGTYGSGGFVDGTGLVPQHAYSVLGLGTSPDGRKFVVLRNPWGHAIPRPEYLVPQAGRWLGRLNLDSGEGGCFALAHGAFSAGFSFLYGATLL